MRTQRQRTQRQWMSANELETAGGYCCIRRLALGDCGLAGHPSAQAEGCTCEVATVGRESLYTRAGFPAVIVGHEISQPQGYLRQLVEWVDRWPHLSVEITGGASWLGEHLFLTEITNTVAWER